MYPPSMLLSRRTARKHSDMPESKTGVSPWREPVAARTTAVTAHAARSTRHCTVGKAARRRPAAGDVRIIQETHVSTGSQEYLKEGKDAGK